MGNADRFRVTVEDLATGGKQAMEVAAGDYILIPFAPCHVVGTEVYPTAGTHVITLKGHRPAGPARPVPAADPT